MIVPAIVASAAVFFAVAPAATVRRTPLPRRFAVLGVFVGLLVVHPALALVTSGVGGIVWLIRRGARRAASEPVPVADVADLLALAVRGGASPHQALREVCAVLPDGRRAAYAQLVAELDAGAPFVAAADRLRDALGTAGAPLVSAMVSAVLHGTELGSALDIVSSEARLQQRRAAELHARRIPVRLLLPLVCCILPAFALLTIVPLLLSTVTSLRG